MKKVSISLDNLSKYLGCRYSEYDFLVEQDLDIFVETPTGDYTKLRGIIRKYDKKLRISGENISFICGEHHKLITPDGSEIFAKNANIIQTLNGPQNVISACMPAGDLIDLAIDSPHLYVTPDGVIHHNTTLARVIAHELGADLLYINASLEGIDSVRMKVVQFSSSVSFSDSPKIVLMDEADGLSAQAQQGIRGVIEEFPNTRYIFTCNFKNKVIDAIHSRCLTIDFGGATEEAAQLQSKFFRRVLFILDSEHIVYEKPIVAELIKKFYPDFRRTLNELQRYGSSGKIDSGILLNQSETQIKELIVHLKNKDFGGMRKWVGTNSDIDAQVILRTFYDITSELLVPSCIPQIILILADRSYHAAMAADPQIILAAAFTEIMATASWKN